MMGGLMRACPLKIKMGFVKDKFSEKYQRVAVHI